MGPSNSINNVCRQLKLAHSILSVSFTGSFNGLINCYWQVLYAAEIGPSNAIGKFSRQLQWAHPMLSTMFVGS